VAPDDLDSMDEGSADLPDPGIDPVADRQEARRLYRGAAALHRNGDLGEALWGYGQAIQRDPSFAAAYSQLGEIRFTRGQFKAAEAALRRAIAIDPGNALAHTRLGEALRRQGRTRDAAISQFRALQIAPDDPRGHLNLGRALRDMGLASEAITSFDRALARGNSWSEKEQNDARWERAQTVLMTGDLASGFAQMDGYWEVYDIVRRGFDAPIWDGTDLDGKSLLVQSGVRMGDVIQFARFLPMLADRGAKILVECHAPLLELMSSIKGVDQVIPRGDVIPQTDFRASIMSLPHLMEVDFERLGDAVPYIDPERRRHRDLPKLSGVHLRVGITWGGRDLHRSDSDRLLMLERFLTLLRVPGVALYSFQRREHAGDLEAVGASELVQDVGPMINDMVDSAALLHDIDLLISVDTAVAHLAGAMGRPVWLMVPHAPEWRWQMDREDSPWYPTFKLFRQKAPGEWDELFDRIGEALRPMVPAGAAGALAAAATTLGKGRPMVDETARARPVEAPPRIAVEELEKEAGGLDGTAPKRDAAEEPDARPNDESDDQLAAAAAEFEADVATEFADLDLPEEQPADTEPEPETDAPLDLTAMDELPSEEQMAAEFAEMRESGGDSENGSLSLDDDQLAAAAASFDDLPVDGEAEFAALDDGPESDEEFDAGTGLDPEQLAAGEDAFGGKGDAGSDAEEFASLDLPEEDDGKPDPVVDAEPALDLDPDQLAAAEELFEEKPSSAPEAEQDFAELELPDESTEEATAKSDPVVDEEPDLSLDDDQFAAASEMFGDAAASGDAPQSATDGPGPDDFAELDLPAEDDREGSADPVVDDEPDLDLGPDQIADAAQSLETAAADVTDGAASDNVAGETLTLDEDQLAAAEASFGDTAGPDFAELELPEEDEETEPDTVVDDEPDLDLETADTDTRNAPDDQRPKPAAASPDIDFAELDLPEDDSTAEDAVVDTEPDLDLDSIDMPPEVATAPDGGQERQWSASDDFAGDAEALPDESDYLDDETMAAFGEAIAEAESAADEDSADATDGSLADDGLADLEPDAPHAAPATSGPEGNRDNPEAMLPAALVDDSGAPRFQMSIRANDLTDPDIKELCRQEAEYGGFNYAARRFLDDHLMPGDLFIDYAAHWGIFTLSAATRWPGDIAVLSVEPSPANFERLQGWLADNHYDQSVTAVHAALGSAAGTALFSGSDGSMRDTYLGPASDDGAEPASTGFQADMQSLDALMAANPELKGRRTFIRLNANGHERDVLAGAQDLLASGDVAAILVSRNRVHDAEPIRGAFLQCLDDLSDAGFHHYRFPHELLGGVLLPYVYNHEFCTVFCLAADFQRWQSYDRSAGGFLPAARPSSVTLPLSARAQWAELLMQHHGTDGGRWANPDNLEPGAEDRAMLIARHLPPEARVLDVGAGVMALRTKVSGGHYQPVDLVARRPDIIDTIVLDLNQEQYPEGEYDVVVLSRVLELIHDPAGLLAHLATLSAQMILVYRVYDGTSAIEERRAAGWFNDFTDAQLKRILKRCGWVIEAEDTDGKYRLFACARDE